MYLYILDAGCFASTGSITPGCFGLRLEIDTHQNSWDPNANHLELYATVGGTWQSLGVYTAGFTLRDFQWHRIELHLDDGAIAVALDPLMGPVETAFQSIPWPNYHAHSWRVAIEGHTGGLNDEHWADNVSISPVVSQSPDTNGNQVPDQCEAIPYCTAGTTTHGCAAQISAVGSPSASQPTGFVVTAANVEGQRMGLLFYGLSPASVAWAINSTSLVCVAAPQQRIGAQNSGGTPGACDGSLSTDFNAFMAVNPSALGSPFAAGETFYMQGWFRDPAAPKQTNLSNGLRFTLCD